jgi:aspartate racemase
VPRLCYLFLVVYSLAIFVSPTNHPKIGIVSGVGPLAGSDVLAKLFKQAALIYGAVEDNEYPDALLVNHGIEGVDNTGTLSARFQREIAMMVNSLENHNATIIGIACNTAHLYLDSIHLNSETILVNLIDTVSIVAAQSPRSYLLLTSNASKQQKLYHGYLKKYGVNFKETNRTQQKLLDQAIGLVMAHRLSAAGSTMDRVLKSAKKAGFTAIIAGCTELPIAIDNSPNIHKLEIIDSNEELAKALLIHYYSILGSSRLWPATS